MPQLAPLIYLSLGGQFEADGKGSICPIIPIEFTLLFADGFPNHEYRITTPCFPPAKARPG